MHNRLHAKPRTVDSTAHHLQNSVGTPYRTVYRRHKLSRDYATSGVWNIVLQVAELGVSSGQSDVHRRVRERSQEVAELPQQERSSGRTACLQQQDQETAAETCRRAKHSQSNYVSYDCTSCVRV